MSNEFQLTTSISAYPNPWSVTWASFFAPIHSGAEPYVRHIDLKHPVELDKIVPLDSITSTIRSESDTLIVAAQPQASMLAVYDSDTETGDVWIRSATEVAAEKLLAETKARIPVIEPKEEQVFIEFLRSDPKGNTSTWSRPIETPDWSTVEANYPAEVFAALERLATLSPNPDDGRIVLWHGPPGTGKTTAIRALAKAWQNKIDVQVLLDPEQVLSSGAALLPLLLSGNEDNWRLLVIEDADELLRVDAKERVGQALSRLLNLGDGLLGQGTKILVLITTNEPIGELHPAIVRPGRCLQECNFRRFTRAEATDWMKGTPLRQGSSFSLAELSTIAAGGPDIAARSELPGLYL